MNAFFKFLDSIIFYAYSYKILDKNGKNVFDASREISIGTITYKTPSNTLKLYEFSFSKSATVPKKPVEKLGFTNDSVIQDSEVIDITAGFKGNPTELKMCKDRLYDLIENNELVDILTPSGLRKDFKMISFTENNSDASFGYLDLTLSFESVQLVESVYKDVPKPKVAKNTPTKNTGKKATKDVPVKEAENKRKSLLAGLLKK